MHLADAFIQSDFRLYIFIFSVFIWILVNALVQNTVRNKYKLFKPEGIKYKNYRGKTGNINK